LRAQQRLPVFPQGNEHLLFSLGASFKERPKVLDEMEPTLLEVLLCLCPTKEQHMGLLHVLVQLGRAA
jgi:hypothetical protein